MNFILKSAIFLILNGIAFANIEEKKSDLFDLCQKIPDAIDRIEEDRCFLKPEKVVFFNGNIYVVNERGNLEALPTVCFTQSGIYVPMASKPSLPQPLWICSKCSWLHYYQPAICERPGCNGTAFIVRYK